MESYKLLITRTAAKELEAVPSKDRGRIIAKIRGLEENPRPQGSEKLSGDDKYRLRQGDYRILYEIRDRELIVTVVRIGNLDRTFTQRFSCSYLAGPWRQDEDSQPSL